MVCLDKDKLINKRSRRKKNIQIEEKPNENELLLKQFNLFTNKVIQKIAQDKLPATPEIYQIYFQRLIQAQPIKQKEAILKVLDLKHQQNDTKNLTVKTEKEVSNSFVIVKSMLNSISDVYKKIHQMQALTKAKKEEIVKNPSKYALISFEENLTSLSSNLNSNLKTLKSKYEQITTLSKSFDDSSIYDTRFETYNKKYLLSMLNAEIEDIKNFEHTSTILAIKIDDSTLNNLKMLKDKTLIMKNVARMIIRISRNSDIVAYFEDGIFIILLKYTNYEQAEQTSTRIKDLTSSASFILDDNEIDIVLLTAVSVIKSNLTKEEIITNVIDNLSQ